MSETLDAIRKRAKAYTEHGTPGLHAPQDRAALLAIIDRMLSEDHVERAAKALHDLGCTDHPWPWERRDEEVQELYREDVRTVITVLKEAAK